MVGRLSRFLLGQKAHFQGQCSVSFREGNTEILRSRKVEEFDPRLIVLYTSCFGSQVANQRRHFETQWKHQNSAGFFPLVIDKSRHEHDDHETWDGALGEA